MKFNRLYYILLSLSLIVASCTKRERVEFDKGNGYINFNVSQDRSLVIMNTRVEDPIYKVKILNDAGVAIKTFDNHKEITEPIALNPGNYTVVGISYNKSTVEVADNNGKYPEDYPAIFDRPVYMAQQEVVVTKGNTQNVDLLCTLSQVKVSVTTDSTITSNFKEVIVTVTNAEDFTNGDNNLIFSSSDGTIGKAGYFKNIIGALRYTITLTNNDGEVSNGDVTGLIEGINAREHYILNLTLSGEDEGSAIVPGITADPSTNDRYYDVKINLNKKAKPSFTAEGLDLTTTPLSGSSVEPVVTYVALGSSAARKVTVSAPAGIKSLIVTHNNDVLANNGVPKRFNLANLSQMQSDSLTRNLFKWSGNVAEATETTIDLTSFIFYLPLGSYAMTIQALDMQNQLVSKDINFTIVPAEETTTLSPGSNPAVSVTGAVWGKHAYLYGMYNTQSQPSGMGFEYKKSGASSWTKVTSNLIVSGTKYYVKLSGLEPETEYVYRAISEKEPSVTEIKFKTLPAYQLYNMRFEEWNGNSANASGATQIWDNGNEAASMGGITPTTKTTTTATSGSQYAVQLKTESAFGVLAAGSHYVGTFQELDGLSGAKINFGKPYGCKPLSLKGYFNYSPATIDKTKSPYSSLKGQSDICQIYVVLADWPKGYFAVNTASDPKVLIDTTPGADPNSIGFGALERNSSTGGYLEFEIPIEYRNDRVPTTCVIVCSSSKYGDYFTGGVGSVLLVDEFEFTF
ncbi:MAG: PCMD domain-containing protein [Bacteroidales bacterium]|nr:PCMD domain-containing protein [Bacteroidales bacterium]